MFFIVTHSPLFYKGLLLVYSSDKSYLKALNQKKKSHFVRNRNRPSILSHSCLVFKFFSTCFHSTILLHHERKATQSFLTQKKTLWASWVGRQKGFAESTVPIVYYLDNAENFLVGVHAWTCMACKVLFLGKWALKKCSHSISGKAKRALGKIATWVQTKTKNAGFE